MASARVIIKTNHCPRVASRFPREVNRLMREQVLESEAHVKTNIVAMDVIDTGFMLNSTTGQMTGEFSGEVTVNAEYAHYQNDGTVFISPRPFFTNEVHRAETAFPARMRQLEGRL